MKLIRRDPHIGYLDANLAVPKIAVNVEGLKKALTFITQSDRDMQALTLWKETEDHLLIPREFWKPEGLTFPVIDCRPTSYADVDLKSRIKLDHTPAAGGGLRPTGETAQQDALRALLAAHGGILQLSCGKGKSVVALEFATRLRVPTLIIVDNIQLLEQWKKEIERHLDVPGGVGLIQGETFDWKKSIVLATYQTLANRAENMPEEVRRWFGLIIWDEAHHVSAPVFSRSADLFYGYRLGLTATPNRTDGLHILSELHIGPILFKNLTQELRPQIIFLWTGLELELDQRGVADQTLDKNGELHLSKLASYFGQWRKRLDLIQARVKFRLSEGRKLLVMSNSVDECINLLALHNGKQDLYTDIPIPTSQEVGETLPARALPVAKRATIKKKLTQVRQLIHMAATPAAKRQAYKDVEKDLLNQLKAHAVAMKVEAELRKRQKKYLEELLAMPSDAGLMIYRVRPSERSAMLKNKRVIFGVAKYAREGLDCPDLDTGIACEPMSNRNGLQQFLGRFLRRKDNKKTPVVEFLEDNIGPMIGMCKILRGHLRTWPVEESGPFDYEMHGHPHTKLRSTWTKPN